MKTGVLPGVIAGLITLTVSTAVCLAEANVITFEDAAFREHPGAIRYSGRGVVFSQSAVVIRLPGRDRPGPNVLISADPLVEGVRSASPLVIQFASRQSAVRLFAGILARRQGGPVAVTLEAFDAEDHTIASSTSKIAPTATPVEMSVSAPAEKAIRKVTVKAASGILYIDNLTFTPMPSGQAERHPKTEATHGLSLHASRHNLVLHFCLGAQKNWKTSLSCMDCKEK